MRIVQWCSPFFPLQGGREQLADTLTRELIAAGHDVIVFTDTQSEVDLQLQYPVIRLTPSRPGEALEAVERFDPDLIHLHNYTNNSTVLIDKFQRSLPVVATFHNEHISSSHPMAQHRYEWINAKVSSVVAVSDFVKKSIEDSEDFQDLEVMRIWNGSSYAPTRSSLEGPIMFAGRLASEKGVGLLLLSMMQVLEVHPKAKLLVLGEGAYRKPLETLANRLGIAKSVQFLGWKSQSELAQLLSTARAMIVPSAWREPFGLVAIEAMLHSVPVIASDVGGLREIVRHEETGLLFQPGDNYELAVAISSVLGDRTRAQSMGSLGRERAEKYFTSKRMTEQYEDLYRKVTSFEK